MKEAPYTDTLPGEYREVSRINAKSAKFGILFNLLSVIPLALVLGFAIAALKSHGTAPQYVNPQAALIATLIFAVSLILYLLFHELLHGLAYKALTGKKLTFGISWSCAFCGVPDIYVSRRTALIALVLPFAVFTVILVPLTVGLFFVSHIAFFLCAALLGLHWGGCVGDLYLILLLLFRYRSSQLLLRDTGPEQYLYLPESETAAQPPQSF